MRDFVRRYVPRPQEWVETVTMRGHLIACGCGEVWKAATSATNSENRTSYQTLQGQKCPRCWKLPQPNTISALEEWTEKITISKGGAGAGAGLVWNPPKR